MNEMVGKCGILCTICPWSKSVQDSMSKDEYNEYKIQCKKILGYAPAGAYQNCVGCQTPEEEWPEGTRIPLKKCLTRLCVMRNEIENCAYCSRFPCDYIKVKANEWSRENVEKKHGGSVSDEDFNTYIFPFESYKRLEEINSKLTPNQIVEVKTVPPLKDKTVPFPDKLPMHKNEITSLQNVHKIIREISTSSLGLKDIDTYAQQERLKARIKHLMRFLWIIGTFAEKEVDKDSLIINAKSYLKNRRSETSLGHWPFMEKFAIKIFKEFGVICELVQLSEEKIGRKGWITPTGALRDRNWMMRVSIADIKGGYKTLVALQSFCKKLEEKYDKKSFYYFVKSDIRLFLE